MYQLYLALALIAGVVLCTGIFSQSIKKGPVQEPLIAMAVGFVAGPYLAGWIDPGQFDQPLRFIEEFSRITLAIALMGVALRLGRGDIRALWPPAAILVACGMTGMWLSVGLLAAWLLDLPLWVALLIGAAVAATDPVVASAIVTGPVAEECLTNRVRGVLSLESGANDGLALLFVALPILMLGVGTAEAWAIWLRQTLIVGVVLATVMGAAIGYAAARLLHWAHERAYMERYSYLTFTVAVSLFTLALGHVTGAESLISVFVAGLAFDMWSDTGERHDEENVQEAFGKLCTLPMYVLFGAAVPIEAWLSAGWPLALFSVAVLLLRRPPILALLTPLLRPWLAPPDLAFLGWFGPIGVAAIYYATYAARHTGLDVIWHVASALVVASTIAHGVTAAPLSRLYARWTEAAEGRIAGARGRGAA